MKKAITTITLEPEILEQAKWLMKREDKKLSTVINSLLKKYVNENDS